ncbi:MAG TPA: hypothetical protein VN718_04205, partial [Rhizomicrobium sp.]|nr:hypothetical protein [Rhizomicrobium sp.]
FVTSATARPLPPPNQLLGSGDATIVSGRAHVVDTAIGTYVVLHRPATGTKVAGYVQWSDRSTFPDLHQLEGQDVQIKGVVGMYGMPLITVTDPDQIEIIG